MQQSQWSHKPIDVQLPPVFASIGDPVAALGHLQQALDHYRLGVQGAVLQAASNVQHLARIGRLGGPQRSGAIYSTDSKAALPRAAKSAQVSEAQEHKRSCHYTSRDSVHVPVAYLCGSCQLAVGAVEPELLLLPA